MPDTFIKIASVTVGSGGSTSVSFSSIPSTYTDLCLKWSARSDANNTDMSVTFNGSSSNFTQRRLVGTGSSVASYSETYVTYLMNRSTATASTFSNAELYIPNYAGSNNKSFSIDQVNEDNATSNVLAILSAPLWSQTAAITSIVFAPNAGNLVQYSTFTLYGIKNS